MLLVGGKKPKIHLIEKGKKNSQASIGNFRKLKSSWAAIQKSSRLRSFTLGSNCVKRRWRAAGVDAPFFIFRDMLETRLPFCSFLNFTWVNESICMTFLHQRHFLSLLVCVPAALWRRGRACCLGKMSFSMCDKHFSGVFTQPRASSPALKHVATVSGNTHLSEPPLFRLQVNRRKLYANVTFS